MPKQFIPPNAALLVAEAPARLVEGEVVFGKPGSTEGVLPYLRYRPQDANGRSFAFPTPVKCDPDTGQLWYDPDWRALSLMAHGRREEQTLTAIEPLMANGLPLSTRIHTPEYGGGRTLLELMVRNAFWTERHVVRWLNNRPDDGFAPDADAHEQEQGRVAPSLISKVLERGWMQVAEILWESKGLRFTPAECASGQPLKLVAEFEWPLGIAPSIPMVGRWRRRALASGVLPELRSSETGAGRPPLGVLHAVMNTIAHNSGIKAGFQGATHACKSVADWTGYLTGWVTDLQGAGVSTSEISSWSCHWLEKLSQAPDTVKPRLVPNPPTLEKVRTALQAVALAVQLGNVLPNAEPRRGPRL